ncbi:hypothetical protein J7426_14315 [Tropicibacter sp. R16_0]|uniref:hypothetical protein n=1 Tax=Tropicibacter sp. R16_0 TaxID=2821102 RepID=UPI001ADA08DA|nr:hypothetical protein [Tropicibacter sp. R16_0]MBO9451444.1 hypothetical protein [Tropicibacter sp. R16_0]
MGYGVSFLVRGFSYAEFKEVESAAQRIAREQAPMSEQAELDSMDDEDISPETEDAVKGRYAHALLLLILLKFGTGWRGVVLAPEGEGEVVDPDAEEIEAPFVKPRIEDFLEQFPGAALSLQQQLLTPYQAVSLEGKGSAPSQSTGIPAG